MALSYGLSEVVAWTDVIDTIEAKQDAKFMRLVFMGAQAQGKHVDEAAEKLLTPPRRTEE